MLKGTGAKLAWHGRAMEALLGPSSLGFVKWDEESAGSAAETVVFPAAIRSC